MDDNRESRWILAAVFAWAVVGASLMMWGVAVLGRSPRASQLPRRESGTGWG